MKLDLTSRSPQTGFHDHLVQRVWSWGDRQSAGIQAVHGQVCSCAACGQRGRQDRLGTMPGPVADLSLPHLRCFVAVVDAGGFAEAGRRMGMSTSAMSKTIA